MVLVLLLILMMFLKSDGVDVVYFVDSLNVDGVDHVDVVDVVDDIFGGDDVYDNV